jgi:hypothetical protein
LSATSSQRRIFLATTRTRNQTARMSRDMASQFQATNRQHQMTRNLVVATFREAQNHMIKQPFVPPSSGREIVYQGKRQDMIVPTLYSIKVDLDVLFDDLYTHHNQDIHPRHLSWLQAEFQNLLASAAQEQARLHPRSTATSFDAWTYPAKRETPNTGKKEVQCVPSQHYLGGVGSDKTLSIQRNRPQSFCFRTRKGTVKIRMPRREHAAQLPNVSDEVGVSLQSTTNELPTIDARFVRLKDSRLAPRIYGQLNIILTLERIYPYIEIIVLGSIPDIDRAFRTGKLCPYRNWEFNGCHTGVNPLLMVSSIRRATSELLANRTVDC